MKNKIMGWTLILVAISASFCIEILYPDNNLSSFLGGVVFPAMIGLAGIEILEEKKKG